MDQLFTNVLGKTTEANKTAIDSLVRLGDIAMRTQSLFARQQMAIFEQLVETGSRSFQAASEIRDPRELMARQVELAAALGERMLAVAQESVEIQVWARDELTGWVQEGIESVQPAMEEAVKTASKPIRKAA